MDAAHWYLQMHAIPIQTICAAYTKIGQWVNTALRTQVGDAAHLGAQQNECLRLLTLHVDLFSAEEGTTIETSIHSMISHLDKATRHSSDPAETSPLTIACTVRTGADDGSITHIYMSSTAPTSNLSDEELDEIMQQVLKLFPKFGRQMLNGDFRVICTCSWGTYHNVWGTEDPKASLLSSMTEFALPS
ncbi:uncharacterized protein EDB91DRAFT_1088453 [Suillus paluster]|uniref:uncharacterized protein n=1 Tax=Suillus paluster TaxID=48578 RepID=UPI001B874E93|nr:uncharacterized protein EDB91DRAFT_1090039 [Suillus paluster]XP_041169295.1 uncharacterized protein EDB91DRAFT_1088453 [Suillus paluster]KAG1718466.1 hypothetical protein EDB91DRAFT_1090039 [Suillus paluster]KAG1721427.1 hypothetical protein EDB91DRAFT_1088453 [Suillus paluster]